MDVSPYLTFQSTLTVHWIAQQEQYNARMTGECTKFLSAQHLFNQNPEYKPHPNAHFSYHVIKNIVTIYFQPISQEPFRLAHQPLLGAGTQFAVRT